VGMEATGMYRTPVHSAREDVIARVGDQRPEQRRLRQTAKLHRPTTPTLRDGALS
jgi:hypothetical protein